MEGEEVANDAEVVLLRPVAQVSELEDFAAGGEDVGRRLDISGVGD